MRRSASKLLTFAFTGMVASLSLLPGKAQAWWSDDWSSRKSITIDTGPSGSAINDAIGNTPVLVRLHSGNFKFDAAKPDGADIRFIAGDDQTPLKYHIEKYDSLLGEAFVWVNIPDLKAGGQTSVFLYYGNKKASPADDSKGTYDASTVLAYHFGERGSPARDSTAWGNTAQTAGLPADGSLIGAGLHLDGQTTVTVPATASLQVADAGSLTWSAWVNETAPQANATIYSRHDGGNGLRIGVDNGAPFVEVTNAAGVQRSSAAAPVTMGTWHHLAVTADKQITIYVDGAPYAVLNAALPAMNSVALLGGDSAPAVQPVAPANPTDAAAPAAAPVVASVGFVGDLDELDISKVARSAGFIKAAAIGQGAQNAKFVAYGIDEETASWASGYLVTILKSVTLDGWVIIGILAVMAVISWVVMFDKAGYIRRLSKANTQFMSNFRHVAKDLTVLDRGDINDIASMGGKISADDQMIMRNSSLYRIYHIGAEEIQHRFAEDGQKTLDAESIAAIRASLDAGLVLETQRLTRQMVILTISISGGPFLGLLGTVVGVMITFAAIAASGDVNVNAIAPGIAAALVATVAGLAVAIPALFGYNYLITRVQESTVQMQVFVDEFVTKMAEFYRRRSAPQNYIAAE
jgi:biopolymer transport protein ExbB